MKCYAVYDLEDYLQYVGSAREVARYLNITLESFYTVVSRDGKAKGVKIYKIKDK